MTNKEFSDEFDVLYNSITSNQAPGLDEYEKSVFLTKAQDEIIKDYFNPKSNKVQEGYDGSERRQIDFSMITRVMKYRDIPFVTSEEVLKPIPFNKFRFKELKELIESQNGYLSEGQVSNIDTSRIVVRKKATAQGKPQTYIASPFGAALFDYRSNSKSVVLDENILMFINEYVVVSRGGTNQLLTVAPINYNEYSRFMSKPYKRPMKYQAWRILGSDSSYTHPLKKSELIVGNNDKLVEYGIRYVRKPRAIILDVLIGASIDGYIGADKYGNPTALLKDATQGISCELDPILHPEILQRAVELAKASYTGDIQSQIALGQISQTDIGAVQVNR